MIYKRTFKFSASHYGPWHHGIVQAAKQNGSISWEVLQQLMAKLHGHNFVVDIVFTYDDSSLSGYRNKNVFGVWDAEIEGIVMEWNNCNISMHEDLFTERWISSTEITARTLARKLLRTFPHYVTYVTVTLHETDEIAVTATAGRGDIDLLWTADEIGRALT